MKVIDRRRHAPAAATRDPRRRTRGIVLHRITYGTSGPPTIDGVIDFWLNAPWGVATTTISDATERMEKILEWEAKGVPESWKRRSFVPYHGLVDNEGTVHQMLDWDVTGAHAYPNSRLIGLGHLGDFRVLAPSAEMVLSSKYIVRDLLVQYDLEPEVMTHDQAKVRWGKSKSARRPKGCPGALFPSAEIAEWAVNAAGIVLGRSVGVTDEAGVV